MIINIIIYILYEFTYIYIYMYTYKNTHIQQLLTLMQFYQYLIIRNYCIISFLLLV